ncbi:MAG: hypothetical protein K2O18_10040 [Oscillospiraceae bacterium]|nr:hypothetical protein [Oscillospiraceae bacterium]
MLKLPVYISAACKATNSFLQHPIKKCFAYLANIHAIPAAVRWTAFLKWFPGLS